ncbi:MAG TPA: N-acetyltransferase [Ktedonobacteraceae bacterium]|nr:N-acetyltransferase [Ktedonobacteraceae bacterium]
MIEEQPTTTLVIRLATPEDIPTIELLDSFSSSPTRNIHRDIEKYFGSVDPSTHEQTCIFLAEKNGAAIGKVELMLPPTTTQPITGYIKRVVVHPQFRGQGLAKQLMQHAIDFAHSTYQVEAIDLHVWEGNRAARKLYEDLGFQVQHHEIYYRLRS